MKLLLVIGMLLVSSNSFAGFEGKSADASLGVFSALNCKTGVTCTKGAKGDFDITSATAFSSMVAATATTITPAQCGSTFYNTAAIQIELPEASTVIGCKLTFVTLNASNFDINPDDADQILVQTNAVGDAIRNATLGNTITLQAVSATQWVTVGMNGTYTDID